MLVEKLKKEAWRRGLSQKTVQTYAYCVNSFLRFFRFKELKKITKREIEEYLDRYRGCGNTLNVYLQALKFFFEKVLNKRLTINISFAKTPKRLPEYLTKEEIIQLFDSIRNSKHRLMIELLYGAGLRVSELASLKVKDLVFECNYGWVRQGKGRKDRLFILPLKLKEKLQNFIFQERIDKGDWLFKGREGHHISVQSIQVIVKTAKKKAGIAKRVHPHTLRHSFATHIIQNGYTALELQPLLGHSRLETTMVYLHTASPNLLNIRSPLDTLPEKII